MTGVEHNDNAVTLTFNTPQQRRFRNLRRRWGRLLIDRSLHSHTLGDGVCVRTFHAHTFPSLHAALMSSRDAVRNNLMLPVFFVIDN